MIRNIYFPGKLYSSCILCGSKSIKKIYGHKNLLVNCNNCNFTFTGLEPSDNELIKYYNDYHAYETLSSITIKRYNKILDKLEKYRQTNNLLETGCGNGIFLEVAKRRNWNVFGTELSDLSIENCKVKGIYVGKSIQDIKTKVNSPFDVIVSMEVIEHLKDPIKEIEDYYNILRNSGALYITTPNFDSLSRRILGHNWNVIIYPEHLNYFNTSSMHSLMQKFNFTKLEHKTSGVSIGRLIYSLKSKNKKQGAPKQEYDFNERDRKLVSTIEKNSFLRLMKRMINSMLSFFNAGDTLKVFYQKSK